VVHAAAAAAELRRINWETWSGMFYSDVTAYCIILATAVTLHVSGVTNAEAMEWQWGLERRASDARAFYGVIAVSVLGALAVLVMGAAAVRMLMPG